MPRQILSRNDGNGRRPSITVVFYFPRFGIRISSHRPQNADIRSSTCSSPTRIPENHPCALVFFSPLSVFCVLFFFLFSIAVHIITRADSPAIISRTRRYRRTSNKRSRCDVCARSIDLDNNVHPHDYTSRAKSRYLQRSVKTNVRARERASKRRRHGARARRVQAPVSNIRH